MGGGPSVYQTNNIARKVKEPVYIETSKLVERTLNILCVDDSSTIHALLKNVLNAEHGFNIKHKAMNGEEALKLLETEKYDAITLDLHMPIIDGLEFLARRKDKTPVIIVSAISREDDSIARKALALGALDYVEKPTRENLVNSGNEIRSKIKSFINKNSRNIHHTTFYFIVYLSFFNWVIFSNLKIRRIPDNNIKTPVGKNVRKLRFPIKSSVRNF